MLNEYFELLTTQSPVFIGGRFDACQSSTAVSLEWKFRAHALRSWDIDPSGKNSVSNLQFDPRTRLARGIYKLISIATLSALRNACTIVKMHSRFVAQPLHGVLYSA